MTAILTAACAVLAGMSVFAADGATGFYGVRRASDGTWRAVDPQGRDTTMFGIDHVQWEGFWSKRVDPPKHRYRDHNRLSYPSKGAWEKETLSRLRSWGFNLFGPGSDPALKRRGLAHTVFLSLGEDFARKGGDCQICSHENRPCSAFPNVFHPDFPAWCAERASKLCAPEKDDRWLFGYFIDNELAWCGRDWTSAGLWNAVCALPDGHSAKRALLEFAKGRGAADVGKAAEGVRADFAGFAAERYFSVAVAAIRKADPNHLVLGARFAGLGAMPDSVWKAAGRHCDVITFNNYPFADLDRGVAYASQGIGRKSVTEAYGRLQDLVGRPMMVSEWSFPALDSGLPCMNGAGQRFRTQKERAAASELFVRTLLSLPYMIGYDYFMWVDEPPEGMSDAFPEDSNYGLVNERGEPYGELCATFARLHADAARLRTLPAPDPGNVPASESGWKGPVLKDWRIGGREIGSFNLMLSYDVGGKRVWVDCNEVKTCRRIACPDGEIRLMVSSGKGPGGSRFEIVHSLQFRGEGRFLSQVRAIRNVGDIPMAEVSVYFRTYAPYAIEAKDDHADGQNVWHRRRKGVPNLWHGPKRDCWLAADGRYFGVVSLSSAESEIRYFLSGGAQHPDAQFRPADGGLALAPGETHADDGRLWTWVVGGTDGETGWLKTVDEISGQK